MKKQDDIFFKAEKDFIKNITGFSVVSLNYYLNEKLIKKASYHLHFLYSYNKEIDMLDVLCLDTNETACIEKYSKQENPEDLRKNSLEEIISIFVKRSLIAGQGKITKNCLLDKVDKKYWDSFNNIKENTYYDGIKQFFEQKEFEDNKKNNEVFRLQDRTTNIEALLETEYIDNTPVKVA
jgi:hypothetical protein